MYLNGGRGVINCAYGENIWMFDSFNVCDNTEIYDIIKMEKKEKDAGKEE